jgi:hypothetical protein
MNPVRRCEGGDGTDGQGVEGEVVIGLSSVRLFGGSGGVGDEETTGGGVKFAADSREMNPWWPNIIAIIVEMNVNL